MEKSPDAFRTISEVAAWLDTPAHVLRFWESRFPEVAPLKRAGGRRYYRPDDMRLLGGIKHLLHTEGQTIKSVQERLRREGVAPVRALSQPLEHDIDERADDLHAASDGAVAKGGRGDDRRAAGDGGDTAPGMEALPPIGFFFDDGADAPDADHQSGTFAPMRGVDGSASGRRDMPEPQDLNPPEPVPDTPPEEAADRPPAATPVPTATPEAPARKPLPPLPDLPPDPAVDASGAPPVPLPLASELRTLVAASLPAEVRAALADAATRLARLHGRSGDVAGTDRDGT